MIKTADFIEHIQELIADSRKVGKAIKAIIEYLKGNKEYSEIRANAIVVSHDYNLHEKYFNEGIEDNKQHRNRIIRAIIKLLDEIEEECEQTIPLEKCQKLHELIGFPSASELATFNPQISAKVIPFLPTPTESEESNLEKLLSIKNHDIQNITEKSSKKQILEAIEDRKRFHEMEDLPFEEKMGLINFKKGFIHFLFENIYTTDALSLSLISDIQNVRENFDKFKWYDRAVVVSALTLSLIRAKKFDEKKANLLIDFLNDSEENVWQRALVGLVLALNYNTNKWVDKLQLMNKLETLRRHPDIQESCRIIDFLFTYKFYRAANIPAKIFEHSFFQETTMHCFLPFYEKNEILLENITQADASFNGAKFMEVLPKLPLSDSLKYWSCLTLAEWSQTQEETDFDKSEKKVISFINSMKIAEAFYPFLNIIADFYNFYSHYPQNTIKDLFQQKLCISQTSLKELILSKVTRCIVDAEQAMNKEKNIKGAILSLEQALKIDGGNLNALYMIVKCCENEGKWKEAIDYRFRIESICPDDYENISKIGRCYANLENYKNAFIYFKRVKSEKPDYVDNLIYIAEAYAEQEKYEESEQFGLELFEKYADNYEVLDTCRGIYGMQRKYAHALPYAQKMIEIKPKKAYSYMRNAICYSEMGNFKEALNFAENAYNIDKQDFSVLATYGRIYLTGKIDLVKAEDFLHQALKIEKNNSIYGNLGHLELAKGNKKLR